MAHHRLLSKFAPDVLERIVSPALPWASPRELEPLCEALLATRRPSAIARVIAQADCLGAWLDETLTNIPDEPLLAALRLIARGSASRRTQLIARIIEAHPRPALAGIMAAMLLDPKSPVSDRQSIGGALIRAAIAVHGDAPASRSSDRATLERSVTTLLERHSEHRIASVAIAGLVLALRPGPHMQAALDLEDRVVLDAIRRGLRQVEHPCVHSNLLRWTATRPLGRAAARQLAQLRDRAQWQAALEASHMLLTPQSRLALRSVDRPVRSLPPRAMWRELSETAQAALPVLADLVGLSRGARNDALLEMLHLPSPRARCKAIRELADAPEHLPAIVDRLTDAQPIVARTAYDTLRRARALGGSVWTRAERSSDAWLAMRAARELAAVSVSQYFTHWLKMDEAQRFVLARMLESHSRSEFLQQLTERLRDPERAQRLAAVRVARRLGVVQRIEPVIIELTDAADPYVASSAVSALMDGVSDLCNMAVHRALEHHHPRVRANAVDVLAVGERRNSAAVVRRFIVDRDNRVRASAIVTASQSDPATGTAALASMLRDDEPMHRISALWAARAPGMHVPLREIRAIAVSDGVPEVRQRAARTLRLLEARAAST